MVMRHGGRSERLNSFNPYHSNAYNNNAPQMQQQQPQIESSNKIYVGNLPYTTTLEAIQSYMSACGEMRICNLLRTPDGRSKGCALIEYASREEADNAISSMNETLFEGRRLAVRYDREPSKGFQTSSASGNTRVYIYNLHWSIQWQELKDFMRKAGDIRFAEVFKTQDTKRPKGYGMVDYVTDEFAKKALDILNNTEFGGNIVTVKDVEDRNYNIYSDFTFPGNDNMHSSGGRPFNKNYHQQRQFPTNRYGAIPNFSNPGNYGMGNMDMGMGMGMSGGNSNNSGMMNSGPPGFGVGSGIGTGAGAGFGGVGPGFGPIGPGGSVGGMMTPVVGSFDNSLGSYVAPIGAGFNGGVGGGPMGNNFYGVSGPAGFGGMGTGFETGVGGIGPAGGGGMYGSGFNSGPAGFGAGSGVDMANNGMFPNGGMGGDLNNRSRNGQNFNSGVSGPYSSQVHNEFWTGGSGSGGAGGRGVGPKSGFGGGGMVGTVNSSVGGSGGNADGNKRIYVGNLAYEVTWRQLKDHFRFKYGDDAITYANVKLSDTKQSKGCGIVEFQTAALATDAIATMNNSILCGRPIFVREDRDYGGTWNRPGDGGAGGGGDR